MLPEEVDGEDATAAMEQALVDDFEIEAPGQEPSTDRAARRAALEAMVQNAVSQYSVLQRMSQDAPPYDEEDADGGVKAPQANGAATPAQAEQADAEPTDTRESPAERNRRLDRELDMELQRALALKPDPTIATTLDMGGEFEDQIEFKPRAQPAKPLETAAARAEARTQAQKARPEAAEPEAGGFSAIDESGAAQPPSRRHGPRIADLLADRIENLEPLREQARRGEPSGQPRRERRTHAERDDDSAERVAQEGDQPAEARG